MALTLDELLAKNPTIFDGMKAQNQKNAEFNKRTGLFTASEIHKLITAKDLKPSNSKTANDYIIEKVWEKFTGERCKAEFSAGATNWGNENESDAVEAYEKLANVQVDFKGDNQKFFKVDKYEVGATTDGLVETDGIIEVKCPYNGSNHLQNILCGNSIAMFKLRRFEYYVQVQTGLWATDRQWADFVSYDPRMSEEFKIFVIRIPRDEAFLDILKGVVRQAEKVKEEYFALVKSARNV